MANVKAVVFDLDGTLVDTSEFIFQAYDHAIAKNGYDPRSRAEVSSQIGKKLEECYQFLVPEGNLQQLMRDHWNFQSQNLALITLHKQYDELIFGLKKLGLRTAIFTSRETNVLESLQVAGARPEDFEIIVAAKDVKKGKPDPEGILLIASKIGVSPSELVMVGDAGVDILAGKNAGVGLTIGLTHGFGTREELGVAGADEIVDTLQEIVTILQKRI